MTGYFFLWREIFYMTGSFFKWPESYYTQFLFGEGTLSWPGGSLVPSDIKWWQINVISQNHAKVRALCSKLCLRVQGLVSRFLQPCPLESHPVPSPAAIFHITLSFLQLVLLNGFTYSIETSWLFLNIENKDIEENFKSNFLPQLLSEGGTKKWNFWKLVIQLKLLYDLKST